MLAGMCAGVSGRASECAGFWGLVGLTVAGFAGAGECRVSTHMFCVGLVVAGFADVVADIAGVGEPRRACSLFFFLLRFVYQV